MDIYRFRSFDGLLGEHKELESQSIYFAGPLELNDPTDGYRDIIWQGDAIAWSNLFKHYIYCVNTIYYKYVVLPKNGLRTTAAADTPIDVPIEGRWDEPSTPEQGEIFKIICDAAFAHLGLAEAAQKLQDTNREVRRDELQAYLDWLYRDLPELFRGVYAHYFASTGSATLPPFDPRCLTYKYNKTRPLSKIISALHEDSEDAGVDSATLFNDMVSSNLMAKYRVRHKLGGEVDELAEKVTFDLTRDYLEALPVLTTPKWSTACFTTNKHNSIMWSSYGDDHKGACLVFRSSGAADDQSTSYMPLYTTLEVAQRASGGYLYDGDIEHCWFELYKVNYVHIQDKIDFFTSIGAISPEIQMKLWYTDDNDNTSTCSSHIDGEDFDEVWEANFRDSFWQGVLSKNKIWSDECEYRIVSTQASSSCFTENSKTLHYRFDDLTGIIFGIRASDDDKMEVMKTVRQKCHDHGRSEFNLYQAHYSDGKIEERPIPVDWSEFEDR